MKKIVLICFMLLSSLLIFAQKKAITIKVTNSSTIQRISEVVTIPWQSILKKYPNIDTSNFKVIDAKTKIEQVFQLEKLGNKEVLNLLLQINLGIGKSVDFKIVKGKPSKFSSKTFARYVPERKDDFAWENDKIAFRVYGKALEGTNENAQGMDIWAKRTEQLIINKWYKIDNYHNDNGEGLDFYSVGMTLGAGDIAPFENGKIIYPNHYRSYEVLENGPLRTTFKLGFESFNVDGKPLKMTKTYTLDAGSQLNKVKVEIKDDANRTIPMVIGLVTSKSPKGSKYMDASNGISSYWHLTSPKNGTLGVAALNITNFDKVFESEGQILSQMYISNDKPIVYYNGGAWDRAGIIKDEQEWLKYLKDYKIKLLSPLKIVVK